MTLRLNGSSSGFTEINAPAAAGSNTLVLPTSNGSANQVLKNSSTAGTLEFAAIDRVKRTYTTETAYTTGDTEIEFTGIPANFSRLRLVIRGLSLTGTNNLKLQIGHAASGGTYLTTGYDSFASVLGATATSGGGGSTSFIIRMGSSNNILDGFIDVYLNKATSPTRLYSNHMINNGGGSSQRAGTGMSPDISSVTIDRIKLIPTGSNTFDNGGNSGIALITEVIE